MAVTNWKSVGESAHQGDMDRARLALDARRVAMAEQAQQFNQQRQMYQDAEAKRTSERAYKDSREDLKYNRDFAERDYADRRADTQYNRAFAEHGYQDQRGDTAYNRAFAERGYQDSRADTQYNRAVAERGYRDSRTDKQYEAETAERAYQDSRADRQYDAETAERGYQDSRADLQYNRNIAERGYRDSRADLKYDRELSERRYADQRADVAFSQMLQKDEHDKKMALYKRQEDEFAALEKAKGEERLARDASTASLLAYAFTNGDKDKNGNILVPLDAIQVFNKGLGLDANNPNALGGVEIMITDQVGNPLAVPQVILFSKDGRPNVLNSDVIKNLASNYPGVLDAVSKGLGDDYAQRFASGFGLVQPQQMTPMQQVQSGYDREIAKYLRSRVEDASKRISAGLNSVREGAGEEDRAALKYWQAMEDLYYQTGRMPTKEEVEAYLNPKDAGGGDGDEKPMKDIDLGGQKYSGYKYMVYQ